MSETEIVFLFPFYWKFDKSEVTGVGAHPSEARGGSASGTGNAPPAILLSVPSLLPCC